MFVQSLPAAPLLLLLVVVVLIAHVRRAEAANKRLQVDLRAGWPATPLLAEAR